MKKTLVLGALLNLAGVAMPAYANDNLRTENRQDIVLGTTSKMQKGTSLTETIHVARAVGRLSEIIFVAKANYAQIDQIVVELGNGEVLTEGPMTLREDDYFVMDLSRYGDYVRRIEITGQTGNLIGPRALVEVRGR